MRDHGEEVGPAFGSCPSILRDTDLEETMGFVTSTQPTTEALRLLQRWGLLSKFLVNIFYLFPQPGTQPYIGFL